MIETVSHHELQRRDFYSDVVAGLSTSPKSLPACWLCDARGSNLFERITQLAEHYPRARKVWPPLPSLGTGPTAARPIHGQGWCARLPETRLSPPDIFHRKVKPMPLLRFDLVAGRSDSEIGTLLDATHRAVLEAFNVPARDRYQVVHQHRNQDMRIEDTGLGISRTDRIVVLQVTSRARSEEAKQTFYKLLCRNLHEDCGIQSSDVLVSFVENGNADWSFGLGRAQFLTGELK